MLPVESSSHQEVPWLLVYWQASPGKESPHPRCSRMVVPAQLTVSACMCMQAAKRTTQALKPGAVTELDAQMLEDIAGDAPSMDLDKTEALRSIPEVMVAVGLQPSKAAAKRCTTLCSMLVNIAVPALLCCWMCCWRRCAIRVMVDTALLVRSAFQGVVSCWHIVCCPCSELA